MSPLFRVTFSRSAYGVTISLSDDTCECGLLTLGFFSFMIIVKCESIEVSILLVVALPLMMKRRDLLREWTEQLVVG